MPEAPRAALVRRLASFAALTLVLAPRVVGCARATSPTDTTTDIAVDLPMDREVSIDSRREALADASHVDVPPETTDAAPDAVDAVDVIECGPFYATEFVAGGVDRTVPRPLTPSFGAVSTSHRPVLRWRPGDGSTGTRIELCADRECATAIQTIDATGESIRLATPLLPGIVFWRLRALTTGGPGTRTSATWHIIIGARDAPLASSWGISSDFNGDGLADVCVGRDGYRTCFDGTRSETGILPGVTWRPTSGQLVDLMPITPAGDVWGDGFADVIEQLRSFDPEWRIVTAVGSRDGINGFLLNLSFSHSAPAIGQPTGALGDIDQDGYSDIVTWSRAVPPRAEIVHGPRQGVVPIDTDVVLGPFLTEGGADFDADGRADFVIARSRTVCPACRTFATFHLGSECGPVRIAGHRFVVDQSRDDVYVSVGGDVNGDGRSDAVVSIDGTASIGVYFGTPFGLSASPGVTLSTPEPSTEGLAAIARDVDGDGYSDVVAVARTAMGLLRIDMFRGAADGPGARVFSTRLDRVDTGLVPARISAIGDCNGDRRDDFVVFYRHPVARDFVAFLYVGSDDGPRAGLELQTP